MRWRVLLAHPWIRRLSTWMLSAVLVAAALPKLADPPAFAQALFAYRLLPAVLLSPVALVLPWLEFWTGLGLLHQRTLRSAALITLGVLLLFLGALGLNLARGNALDCGCFGTSRAPRTQAQRFLDMKLAMARDVALALIAIHLLAGAKWTAPKVPPV